MRKKGCSMQPSLQKRAIKIFICSVEEYKDLDSKFLTDLKANLFLSLKRNKRLKNSKRKELNDYNLVKLILKLFYKI